MPSVIDRLVSRDAERLDVPMLQPAEPFLELAGEELRRRVFLAEDERGRLRCLRPELTIPAARAHIAARRRGPARYALAGTVFRQRGGEDEFPQAGIETIGGDAPEEDARALADAVALVDDLAPGRRAAIVVGDRAIHGAALAGLGLSEGWIARLARVHGERDGAALALAGLDAPLPGATAEERLGADPTLPPSVREALERDDRTALERAVADAIAGARMGKGARGPREIATRLRELHATAGGVPDAAQRDRIARLLALRCPLDALERALAGLGVAPPEALAHHAARLGALRERGIDGATAEFRMGLGRSLDYYTGLVFEMHAADGTVLAAGGRYDRLLGLLGGASEPAVGFALWLDRLGVGLDGSPR